MEVRWSERIERNNADGPFSAACYDIHVFMGIGEVCRARDERPNGAIAVQVLHSADAATSAKSR